LSFFLICLLDEFAYFIGKIVGNQQISHVVVTDIVAYFIRKNVGNQKISHVIVDVLFATSPPAMPGLSKK